MTPRTQARALIAAVVSGVVLMSACGHSGGITVSARFADVADLSPGAPVMMDDVTVGKVTGIVLEGYQARVRLRLDPSAQVPVGVTARVRRTSLLGERIIDLVVPVDLPDRAPTLRDGDTIAQTEIRPDLEDLVQEGTDVLAPIAASDVATLVNEGAKGFAGNGLELRGLLVDFQTIVHGYSQQTGDIETVISSLDQLNTTMALKASAHALALGNSQQALDVLREESDRLKDAVHALARLSVGSRAILDQHVDEMARFFAQMKTILGVLNEEQATINNFLAFAPLHNRNTQLVEFQEMNQILQQFVICGFNDDPSDPARNCTGGVGTR